MAKILIEPVKVKATLSRQAEIEKVLNELYQGTKDVRAGLNYKIAGQEAISARLNTVAEQIRKEADGIRAMRSGLEQIITQYEQTERTNLDRVGAEKASVRSTEGAGFGGGGGGGRGWGDDDEHSHEPNEQVKNLINKLIGLAKIFPFPGYVPPLISGLFLGYLGTLPFGEFLVTDGEIKNENKIKIDLKKALKEDGGFFKKVSDFEDKYQTKSSGMYYYDTKTGKVTTVDPDDKKAVEEFKKHNKGTIPVDVRMAGVGASGSISAWGVSGNTGDAWAWGGASGSVDVGKLEGEASAYLGVLGVGGTVGASFTAFTAEERAYLGTDDLQVYEKVSVSAGKVETKGQVDVGLIDKEGNFNPSLYGGVSAEAIAGEVSGSVGVKALGTDIGLKASANVGVGAHANVGIHDGKISLDVGASLGVGASIKLDIDVSGTVAAVGDFVGNVSSGVKDFFSWLNPWD